jgi:hypothetical protein
MNIRELRCGGAKQFRKKKQIEDGFPHLIYKLDLRYGWMHTIFEPPGLLGSWIGNASEHFEYVIRCPRMPMDWSYLCQYGFIICNLLHFWIQSSKTNCRDRLYSLLLPLKFMAKKSIKYPALKIIECTEVSYSIWFDGLDMIPLRGSQPSSLMDYKQWRSIINDILGSRDCWRIFPEDLEPQGGILPRSRNAWRYSGIMEEGSWWCGRNCDTERQRR